MAVQFELYKTPMPKEKKNKVRYHARPISYETVNTKKLVYRIHDRCSLSPSDVTATLEELKYEVAHPKDKRVHKVKLKAIKFKADKELKAELSDMEFHRSKYRPHSAGLSEVEIDMELTKYFAENQLITRKDFQYLCGMTQITAYRHIKRLIAEKKLQNKGTTHQPIYTPVPGNYRVSVAVKYKE